MEFYAFNNRQWCTIHLNEEGQIITVQITANDCPVVMKSYEDDEFKWSAIKAISLILHWDKECFKRMREMLNPEWKKIAEDLRLKERNSWDF